MVQYNERNIKSLLDDEVMDKMIVTAIFIMNSHVELLPGLPLSSPTLEPRLLHGVVISLTEETTDIILTATRSAE